MAFVDDIRSYLAEVTSDGKWYRDELGQLRPKPSAYESGVQYGSRADTEALEEPAFSPVDLIDPDILRAMYIPVGKKALNALARMTAGETVDDVPRVFSALHDRMPRVEVDDSGMRQVVPSREWVETRNGTMMAPSIGGVYSAAAANLHPNAPVRVRRLYESDWLNRYGEEPLGQDFAELPIGLIREGTSQQGMFNGEMIGLNEALTPQQAKPTILHELQHAVQERGGFARGGSPDDPALVDVVQAMLARDASSGIPQEQLKSMAQRNAYERLAGEIEARDTAARMSMNALDRARTQPYTGYQVRPDGSFGPAYDIGGDIPLEDYIVRMK